MPISFTPPQRCRRASTDDAAEEDDDEEEEVVATGEVDPANTPIKQAPVAVPSHATPEPAEGDAKHLPAEAPAAAKELFAAN